MDKNKRKPAHIYGSGGGVVGDAENYSPKEDFNDLEMYLPLLENDQPNDMRTDIQVASPEPERPQFDAIKDDPDLAAIAASGIVGGAQGAAERASDSPIDNRMNLDEIRGLIDELEGAQKEQRARQSHARQQAFSLRAGDAVGTGFTNNMRVLSDSPLEREDSIPIPEKYDVAKAKLDSINMQDKLRNSQEKWESAELMRQLKDTLNQRDNTTKQTVADTGAQAKKDVEDKREAHDTSKTKFVEGEKNKRAEMMARSGLAGKILGGYISAGKTDQRADQNYANQQATFQIPGWLQEKPNSPTDHTKAAELAGSEEAFWQVGKKLADGIRKNGRAFPQSTEWSNVAGDYMALNQSLNHLNLNGVMNFKDKDNNDVQIGNAQALVQYVLNNGPDVLDHALDTMRMKTNAEMKTRGYARSTGGQWTPKQPKDYLGNASGGGGMSRQPSVSPQMGGSLGNWVVGGGEFPNLNAQQPQIPQSTPQQSGPAQNPYHQKKQKVKIVNGQAVITWE